VEKNEGINPTLLGIDCRVNLIKEEIDLAIRIGEMPSSDYKQRKLGSFRDVLCASPGYLEKHGITQAKLLKQQSKAIDVNYIANSWQGAHIKHALSHKKNGKLAKLVFAANRMSNSLPAVISMTKAGCGLAFLPDFIFNRYKCSNELTEVMPDYLCELASVYAVHAYASTPPTLVRLVIEAIKNMMSESMEE
jgi:DNA-binding transcriptional LysR family regulator